MGVEASRDPGGRRGEGAGPQRAAASAGAAKHPEAPPRARRPRPLPRGPAADPAPASPPVMLPAAGVSERARAPLSSFLLPSPPPVLRPP